MWTAGLTNTLRYKSVELSVLIDVRWGARIFSATNLLGAYSGVLAETAARPDTGLLLRGIDVATGNANATHVSTENYYHSLLPIQERWVYDASFAKLREVRLTFAVATSFAPEILLMDEWIMAGDDSFITKARHRIDNFVAKASILVLASHAAATWASSKSPAF